MIENALEPEVQNSESYIYVLCSYISDIFGEHFNILLSVILQSYIFKAIHISFLSLMEMRNMHVLKKS